MPKDALGHGSNPQGLAGNHLPVWYHGSPTGFPGLQGPIHVGTYRAARMALEARIGVPADGRGWEGNREYGKTSGSISAVVPSHEHLTGLTE